MAFPWQDLSPTDYYKIDRHASLSFEKLKVLTLLYQPLMGGNAYRLYLFLHSQSPGIYQTKDILTLLDMGLQTFFEARIKLEGLGLLKTYQKEESYIYHLAQPVSARDFFKEDILRLALVDKVGSRVARGLVKSFQAETSDKEGYQDISRRFTDVFSHQPRNQAEDVSTNGMEDLEEEAELPLDSTMSTFDEKLLASLLSKNFVNPSELQRAEVRKKIQAIHTLYGWDELEMAQLITDAADVSSGIIDIQKMDQAALKKQEAKEKQKGQKRKRQLEMEKTPETSLETFTSDERGLIEAAKALSPMEFLESIKSQKKGKVTYGEWSTVNKLVNQSGFTGPIINILIHYLLVQEEVALNDFKASEVVDLWMQRGVTSPEAAMKEVKKVRKEKLEKEEERLKKNKKTFRRGNPRVENLPEWARDEGKDRNKQKTKESDKKIGEVTENPIDFDAWYKEIRGEDV